MSLLAATENNCFHYSRIIGACSASTDPVYSWTLGKGNMGGKREGGAQGKGRKGKGGESISRI